MEKKGGIQEGPAIYIESILSLKEFSEMPRLFPNTCHLKQPRQMSEFESGEFKWRLGMGNVLSADEIKLINKRIDDMMKKAGLFPECISWSTTF
jgi:hypothetical protein